MKKSIITLFVIGMSLILSGQDLTHSFVFFPDEIGEGTRPMLRMQVRNIGYATSASCKIQYQLVRKGSNLTTGSKGIQDDITIDLGFRQIEPISAGQMLTVRQYLDIPEGLSGKYYLKAFIDKERVSGDLDYGNNILSKSVSIEPRTIDLVATEVSFASSVVAGQRTSLEVVVKNVGTDRAVESHVRYYLSNSPDRTGIVEELGWDYVRALSGYGGDSEENNSFYYPSNVIGTYYLLIEIDADDEVVETNEDNNLYADLVNVSAPENGADLIITEFTGINNVFIGDKLGFSMNVKNIGIESAQESTLKYYLCRLPSINPTYTVQYLGSDYVRSISPGIDSEENHSATIESGIPEGTYYIVCVADADNDVPESNENNNIHVSEIYIDADPDFYMRGDSDINPGYVNSAKNIPFTIGNNGDGDNEQNFHVVLSYSYKSQYNSNWSAFEDIDSKVISEVIVPGASIQDYFSVVLPDAYEVKYKVKLYSTEDSYSNNNSYLYQFGINVPVDLSLSAQYDIYHVNLNSPTQVTFNIYNLNGQNDFYKYKITMFAKPNGGNYIRVKSKEYNDFYSSDIQDFDFILSSSKFNFGYHKLKFQVSIVAQWPYNAKDPDNSNDIVYFSDVYVHQVDKDYDSKDQLSISKEKEINIDIYPNPATNHVVVNNYCGYFSIVNSFGYIVNQGELYSKEKIDISNLNSGIYFIKLGNTIQKFIKQ
jgi:hypothetical protein